MSLVLDRRNFDRSLVNYRAQTSKALRTVLLDEGSLLVRDLIKLTPPHGPNPIHEKSKAQQKRGKDSVKRDVLRVLRPLDQLQLVTQSRNQKLRDTILRAGGVTAGASGRKRINYEQTQRLLRKIGIKNNIIRKADPELHRRARGSRGRVPKGTAFNIVIKSSSVKTYIAKAQKSVGRAKKGWLVAAQALGSKGIPQWVWSNPRPAPGSYRFTHGGPATMAITVANKVPYAGDFRALGVVQFALQRRRKNMVLKAQRAMRALHRKRL